MRLALLSGAFPPDLDGIGDYTWWLSKTLVEQGHAVTVFTSRGPKREPAPGVDVHPFFDPLDSSTLAPLAKLLEEKGFDWLIVQYNPFSFGKRGYCPGLIKALNTMKRRSRCPNIAVMFHETMVPRWPWRFAVMRLWQKRQFKQLCRLCDQAFASTDEYLRQIKNIEGSAPAKQLVVGSNIPPCNLSKHEAREKLDLTQDTLLVGVFGTAHVSRQIGWIGNTFGAILKQNPKAMLKYIGPDGPTVAQHFNEMPFQDMGPLPGESVAVWLKSIDILLSPFSDGISTRRGSVIAAIENNLPVATTHSKKTDLFLMKLQGLFTTSVDEGESSYKNMVLNLLEKDYILHPETDAFKWEKIVDTLVRTISQI